MAAASWSLGPGAGLSASGALGSIAEAKTLSALDDMAATMGRFTSRLQNKEQLDEQQLQLAKDGTKVEQTGGMGEQVSFRVDERVGQGTFCVVFRGELLSDKQDQRGKQVAIKFELRKNDSTQLRNEFRMYKKLADSTGIANIYTFGEIHFHKVLVMDLLGPSLEAVFQQQNHRFSVKTVTMLAKRMLARIQTVHENGLIYRDIKPENFLIGLPQTDAESMVYLVDFGMAKMYRDPETNEHIPFGEAHSLSGTARYMSINAHCKRSQSRRDDLEALGHVFMYFLRGNLPWQGVKAVQHNQRYDIMCEKKMATTITDLCQGYPPQFAQYLSYARELTFDGDPDYNYMQDLLTSVLTDMGETDDGVYDWLVPISIPLDRETALPEAAAATAAAAGAAAGAVAETATPETIQPEQKDVGIEADAQIRQVSPTPDQNASASPAPLIAPSSPPGKRRRSEFSSDLTPPLRARQKKATFSLYDSSAQKELYTLYREVMAKRYSFYRSIGRSARGGGPSAAVTAAAAAAAAASVAANASASARSGPPLFRRAMGASGGLRQDGNASSGVSPVFTQSLDKTLGLVISELEDMSDKLLQGGDWTGVSRVRGWFDEVAQLSTNEAARLRAQKQQQQQQPVPIENDASLLPPLPSAMRVIDRSGVEQPKTTTLVAVDDLLQADQAKPSPSPGQNLQLDDVIQPRVDANAAAKKETNSGNTENVAKKPEEEVPQRKMHDLTIAADDTPIPALVADTATTTVNAAATPSSNLPRKFGTDLDKVEVDDDEENNDNDDDNTFALVYRTASGSRRVVRFNTDEEKK